MGSTLSKTQRMRNVRFPHLWKTSSVVLFSPLGILALYCVFNAVLRAAISPTLGTDDMFENVFVQDLRLGYELRQPPLYEWLLYMVQQIVGPTIWSFQIVKYTCVFIAGVFIYAIAQLAIPSKSLAGLSLYSYVLLFQIGFNLHEGVTHTAVLMATTAMTTFYFVSLLLQRTLLKILVLGLVMGLGFLSKYSFIVVPIGLLFSACLLPYWRQKIKVADWVIGGGVALAIISPFSSWVLTADQSWPMSVQGVMLSGVSRAHWQSVFQGEVTLALSLLGFASPLLPIFLGLYWRELFFKTHSDTPSLAVPKGSMADELTQLLMVFMLTAVTVAAVGIALSGATYIKERLMHPFLLLLPVYLFGTLARKPFSPQKNWIMQWIILGSVLLVFLVRTLGFLAPDTVSCGGTCRQMMPYARFVERLEHAFPEISRATIVSLDDYTGGNMRAHFPKARHKLGKFTPSIVSSQQCFLIWDAGTHETPVPLQSVLEKSRFKGDALSLAGQIRAQSFFKVNWPHLWKEEGYRFSRWGVVRLEPANRICL
ncbi:glycosyltransferase family 39 protein [Flexibacterium corallicola]|uniref:glycosyltransferase family 39 protein n=1 Tax=Flexibacterium corallicola TaxID=3037259 RepID=UPI00286EDD38|nr:glycosyltransferase family 39 protein [Pseudovibrio sp. M1P-2-3]